MSWWHRPSAPRGLLVVMELLAVLVALSVLLTFYQVVRSSVKRGELVREIVAERALATHYCNTLSALGAGESCLLRLKTPAKTVTAP